MLLDQRLFAQLAANINQLINRPLTSVPRH